MGVSLLEILTIRKVMPYRLKYNIQDPLILINELKKVVKELKTNNPYLKNYKLMDVGFAIVDKQKSSHMSLYFKKEAL